MNLAALALRALLVYLYLLLLTRLAGRRGLKQTTALDLVVALLLGSLTASFAFGDLAASSAVAATGTILLLHLGAYYAACRSRRLGRLLGLRPVSADTVVSAESAEGSGFPV
jgi:uncharacterized membrane protein YcaP (DUF421 family)